MLKNKTAAFHNLGCKVNAYEMEGMEESLRNAGYEIVPFSEKADVYVINTCTVTRVADQKSRQMISRAKTLNPDAIVVACGCYANTGKDVLIRDGVADIILGNNEKSQLNAEIEKLKAARLSDKNVRETFVPDINKGRWDFEETAVSMKEEHTRAFLKVEDGCDQFCTYCIIPFARGRERSRDPEKVVEEVKMLSDKGFREFVLTGIRLTSYSYDNITLVDLIERVSQIDGVHRIRLGSLEPKAVTEDFAKRLSELKNFCPHFHMSLQSGSDSVLKRMNRHYSSEEFMESIGYLRKYFDDPAITADMICGFPGETEEEFRESVDFAKRVGFYEIHVFPYSVRQGTRAEKMPGQLSKKEKAARTKILRDKALQMKQEYLTRHLGRRAEALLEETTEINGKTYWTGYTPEYIRVLYESDQDMSGRFVTGVLKKIEKGFIHLSDGQE
ncbi:MAG: tRNA (N(6)-L-threonylcarbamoyladenosine(37)-C(2))-methylthiotransferase MtaB [Lachnospiraceae bacterium]|nr:tRNA (N(6)-L-threonylcarbamoyladenosine(37)-C(2))-methylthiotransferase MtaB [Lachnospiraceae bacterium]